MWEYEQEKFRQKQQYNTLRHTQVSKQANKQTKKRTIIITR